MAADSDATLSVVDTSFLNLERDGSHMHVGGITLFDGPPPPCPALLDHIASRLHLVPRYRQKVVWPRLQLGRPRWVDDPCFALDYHIRHTALPRPGGHDELRKLAARVFSQRLDRDRPLWEMWFVEGLEGDAFAIVNKVHHALIDGMSGVDLLSVLFDLVPEPRAVEPPGRPWLPRPGRSELHVTVESAAEVATRPLQVAARVAGAARRPDRAMGSALDGAKGLRDLLLRPALNPAPDVPLNTSIGPHRRVEWVSTDLADFKVVKNALGGTVNDVVLAVVAGALRRWLHAHGIRTEGLELRAMVPVSIRTKDERHQLGNRVAAMLGPLPVYVEDPVQRLAVVQEAMRGLKESKQALGAEVLAGVQEFAPPTILAQAARINFHPRLFNTIVTNVPGPQVPLYLLGRRLTEIVPVGFLPDRHAVFFAVMSYDGKLDFGLLGDRDAMRDLDDLATGIVASLDELRRAAGLDRGEDGRSATAGPTRRRAPAAR